MSTNTISEDERTYGRLLGRTLPRVIHSDDECERLTSDLMRLDEQKDSSPEEKELAELLTVLVGEYEGRRYPIRKSSPRRTLQHLMEARGLTQKDLWKTFESKGITSEVFHGKRAISKMQARKLAEFFHISVELFIWRLTSARRIDGHDLCTEAKFDRFEQQIPHPPGKGGGIRNDSIGLLAELWFECKIKRCNDDEA